MTVSHEISTTKQSEFEKKKSRTDIKAMEDYFCLASQIVTPMSPCFEG